MIRIDRMQLADLGNSVAIAEAVLNQLGDVRPPIPVEEIAGGCGITDIRAVANFGFEGALIANAEKTEGLILVNSAARPQRRRFTVGHELGHLLNPWHVPPSDGFHCTSADLRADNPGVTGRPQWEAQANEFASNLLLPRQLFSQDIKKLIEPGLDEIAALAARYETSLVATARRFFKLHGEPMALVVTHDLVIDQMYRDNGFPYIAVARGQEIHRATTTAAFRGSIRDISTMESVEPSLWIDSEAQVRRELYEQVLVQSNGYRSTLLTLGPKDADDEDDTGAAEHARWNPQFHR